MNILKYLLSKTYRESIRAEYAKDLCSKIASEQDQVQEIYMSALGNSTSK